MRTPLLRMETADRRELYLKLENRQPIGSFKLRGAYNKIAQLTAEQKKRGVIAYSSGNHAQGVAYAARALEVHAVIVMPASAPQVKLEATAALGAEIVRVGPSSSERQARAEALAAEHGYAIIPPFNDEQIIAGQGTCGLEILEDLPDVASVLVPVGGGGMISGVSSAIKSQRPEAAIIGIEPELAADAQATLRAGRIQSWSAEQVGRTLADGLRTQAIGDINFAHIRSHVDRILTVSEDAIRDAMRTLLKSAGVRAEPSGAVSAAGFFTHATELPQGKTVAIVTGGNITPEMAAEIERG